MKKANDDEEKEDKDASVREPAKVIVKAPADAVITVNGQETTRRKTEELFLTPDLRPGYTYAYLFKARAVRNGKTVNRTQRILVRAGQESRVDFSDLGKSGPREVARVKVLMPRDARLYVDGVAVGSTGATRTFETPALEAGQVYSYTFKAEVVRSGRTQSRSKRIKVEAGKEVTVNFRDLGSVQAVRR
jgi:uncharacterized protein (TIGR03000 family)